MVVLLGSAGWDDVAGVDHLEAVVLLSPSHPAHSGEAI